MDVEAAKARPEKQVFPSVPVFWLLPTCAHVFCAVYGPAFEQSWNVAPDTGAFPLEQPVGGVLPPQFAFLASFKRLITVSRSLTYVQTTTPPPTSVIAAEWSLVEEVGSTLDPVDALQFRLLNPQPVGADGSSTAYEPPGTLVQSCVSVPLSFSMNAPGVESALHEAAFGMSDV